MDSTYTRQREWRSGDRGQDSGIRFFPDSWILTPDPCFSNGDKMKFYIVDVFAEEKYTGNQLAVIRGTEGLSDETMQALAREMNYSGTTFILRDTPRNGGFDVRIFTPVEELPFAGHPTLGTAYVIQREIIGDVFVGGKYHNGNTAQVGNYGIGNSHNVGGVEESTGYVNPLSNLTTYFNQYWSGYTVTKKLPATLGGSTTDGNPVNMIPNESYSQSSSSGLYFHPKYANTMFAGKDNTIQKSTDIQIIQTVTAMSLF